MSTKITALTAKTTPAAADIFPLVDPADATMAVTGTDKKMTFAQIEAGLTLNNQTGVVAATKGGTAQSAYATGDTLYASAANTLAKLPGNATTAKNFLTQTGTGAASQAPAWGAIAAVDVPTLNQSTTGSAASFTGSLAGDVTGTQAATVVGKINGTSLAGLATGIVKNTTTTGVPSIAVAGDFPTLNQDTTGKSAKTDALNSATTIVNVAAATAPVLGQVLTATSGTAATWQTPAAGGGQTVVTKVVAATGGDYTTVSAAIAAASAGWTIKVMPGTYTETGIPNTVTVANISIVGGGTDNTILDFNTTSSLLFNTTGAWHFENIKLLYSTGYITSPFAGSSFTNVYFSKTGGTNALTFDTDSLRFTGCRFVYTGADVTNPFISALGALQSWSGNTFDLRAAVTTNINAGVIKFDSYRCAITGNTFIRSNGTGTLVSSAGNGNTFTGNGFYDGARTTTAHLALNGANMVATGNTFQNGDVGINVGAGGSNAVVTGNALYGGKIGVQLQTGANYCVVSGNTILGAGTATVSSKGISSTGNNCVVVGNTVTNHNIGLIIETGATKNNASANVSLTNATNLTDNGTTTTVNGTNITV